jgi:FlaA1/EpsC-like NDP-sugar epimerase
LFLYFLSIILEVSFDSLYVYLILYFILIILSRLIAQSIVYKNAVELKNILIYGAGISGNKLYHSMKSNSTEYNVVGFIDDDINKQKERIDSIKIYSPEKILELSKKYDCYGVFIAMPSIDSNSKKEIVMKLLDINLVIKIVPSVKSIVEKSSNFSDMRNITIEDLINRSTVNPIQALLEKNIKDKTVLVTGGGGSIGSELVSQISALNPQKVVIIDMNELNIFNLKNKIKNLEKVDIVLGSLLDKHFLKQIFTKYKFNIIFHAAAYKHVSIVEDNILYAVMNNVISTFYIGDFSSKFNVNHFVLVSTDKAVKPSNYMGKSKLIAEMIINQLSKLSKTKFSIVRFGNVLNSSGSVLSIFNNQIQEGGPLTVTDKKVSRYFMSIPEAAQLIIQSSAISDQYRTFILEMGESYNIYELAKKIIQINGFQLKTSSNDGIEIKIIGLQKGEKLHEELTFNKNLLKKTKHPKIYATQEVYFQFNLLNWMKEFEDLYEKNDLENFKNSIDNLVSNHNKIN